MNKLASVIIPVYNVEKYLNKCVDSVLNQTYQNLEIILVDDGSKDGSSLLCDEYLKKDGRIQVIHKENGGLVSAWTAGVAKSEGDYLCFVDSDDWVDATMIDEMMKLIAGIEKEMICCNFVIETSKEQIKNSHLLAPGTYTEDTLRRDVFQNILGNENRIISMSRCMKLISRKLIEDNLCYCKKEIKMGEDVNIILPAILDAKRIVIMKEAYYYHYFYNPVSMVHAYDSNLYVNVKKLYSIIDAILLEKGIPDAKRQAKQEYIFLLMLVLKNEARGNQTSYLQNIKDVCKKEDTKTLILNTPVQVEEKSNQLLYFVMKHPNYLSIRILKFAITLFYIIRNFKACC